MNDIAKQSVSRPLSSTLALRATRRCLASAWALCCLGFVALAVSEVKGFVWFVLIALTLAVDVMLYAATHRITDRPTSALDERERMVRNRAYRAAYVALFFGLLVVVGGALILFYLGDEIGSGWLSHPADHPELLSGLGLAVLQVASLLPTAIVAWSEEDEPGEFE